MASRLSVFSLGFVALGMDNLTAFTSKDRPTIFWHMGIFRENPDLETTIFWHDSFVKEAQTG